MQQDEADDYVASTGVAKSVRDFVLAAFKRVGVKIVFEGTGTEEVGRDASDGTVRVRVSPKYYRPAEVEYLLGDSSKAKKSLGWKPNVSFEELVHEMVDADVALMKRNPEA